MRLAIYRGLDLLRRREAEAIAMVEEVAGEPEPLPANASLIPQLAARCSLGR